MPLVQLLLIQYLSKGTAIFSFSNEVRNCLTSFNNILVVIPYLQVQNSSLRKKSVSPIYLSPIYSSFLHTRILSDFPSSPCLFNIYLATFSWLAALNSYLVLSYFTSPFRNSDNLQKELKKTQL